MLYRTGVLLTPYSRPACRCPRVAGEDLSSITGNRWCGVLRWSRGEDERRGRRCDIVSEKGTFAWADSPSRVVTVTLSFTVLPVNKLRDGPRPEAPEFRVSLLMSEQSENGNGRFRSCRLISSDASPDASFASIPPSFHQLIWATRYPPAPIRQIHFSKWIKGTALRIRHVSRGDNSTCSAKISSVRAKMLDDPQEAPSHWYKGTSTKRDIKTSVSTERCAVCDRSLMYNIMTAVLPLKESDESFSMTADGCKTPEFPSAGKTSTRDNGWLAELPRQSKSTSPKRAHCLPRCNYHTCRYTSTTAETSMCVCVCVLQ